MQTLDDKKMKELDEIAKKLGIKVQELIRVRIIPEWLEDYRKHNQT